MPLAGPGRSPDLTSLPRFPRAGDGHEVSAGTRKNPLRISSAAILILFMIRRGFLDPESRKDLIELARDGSAAHRLGRRANAILLLDDGMTCEATARVLFVDDDTVRTWYQDYRDNGIEGLANFGHEGSACRLTAEQQDALKTWIAATLPAPPAKWAPGSRARAVSQTRP